MQITHFVHAAIAHRPAALATVCGDRKQSWSQFGQRISKLAGALKALGAASFDPIAILALNSDRYTEYYYGAWWGGFVVVPMNTRWSSVENAYSLNDSKATILFVDDAFLPTVQEIIAQTNHDLTLIYMGEQNCPQGMLDYDSIIENAEAGKDAGHAGEELAGIYYTGGTTGFPKGVMLPHRAIWYNGLVAAKHFNLQAEDGYLHAGPMFHLADGAGGNGAIAVGATNYYLPVFTPEKLIDLIEKENITHSLLVPTMIQMMMQSPSFATEKFSSLKTLIYGASPMPKGVLIEALKKLPHADFIQGYGQTEMAPLLTTLGHKEHVIDGKRLSSAGSPVSGTMLRLVDEEGDDVARGEVGEIVAYGPGTMLGYLNKQEETAATLVNGGVYTGDGAYMDDDGFVFIVDRVKDMIVSGGENVFSAEVENAISLHPAVTAVAVIGIPHEKWGEAVHAIVIVKDGEMVTSEEIKEYCKGQIAGYKCPVSINFRTEPFPLSGAGKVLKRELRAPFWKSNSRNVG